MLASLPESNTPWERITYVGSVPSGDKFPLQLSFLHWNNFLFMFSAWESSSLALEELAGSSSLCWRVATGRELVEEWISTTTGGSLATEVGLLHHPEATHLLFPVIEDVTLWSVGQFPIMSSYLRGPHRYWSEQNFCKTLKTWGILIEDASPSTLWIAPWGHDVWWRRRNMWHCD